MDASKIASHITNIEALRSNDAEEIKPMLEKFPYASTLYILHLKALANDNSLDFEQKLRVAAAHVSDREHLYQLINKNNALETKQVNRERITEEEIEEEIQTKKEKIEGEKDLAKEQAKIEEEVSTEKKIKLNETTAKEVEEVLEEKVDDLIMHSSLDEDIFSHAIATAFEHSSDELIGATDQKDEIKETKPTEKISITEEVKPVETPEDISFIEWLILKKSDARATEYESSSLEDKDDTKLKAKEKKNIVEEIKQSDEKRMSKKEINALLDKFISEQPSISKPVKEFFDPSTNAKKSVEESSELVSETLAQIHVMQGNYTKAIRAYKQLSLLYPEKKAFFASQIKKIERKLS